MSYDVVFLHVGWHPQKKPIDSVISSSLSVRFLSFGLIIQSFIQISWFFYIKLPQNCLVFWVAFFARQFGIMIEANWINFGYWRVLAFFTGVPWSQACFSKISIYKFGVLLFWMYFINVLKNILQFQDHFPSILMTATIVKQSAENCISSPFSFQSPSLILPFLQKHATASPLLTPITEK